MEEGQDISLSVQTMLELLKALLREAQREKLGEKVLLRENIAVVSIEKHSLVREMELQRQLQKVPEH